jgi:hypothetical protein
LVSTRNTGEANGWLGLLSALTDEELDRYGEIARDQRNLEFEKAWAQGLCVIGAFIAFGFAVREVINQGVTQACVALLLAAAALGFWPYQKARMRWLWNQHCAAVAREKARRAATAVERTD